MAIYVSRRNKMELSLDAKAIFIRMLKGRIRLDKGYCCAVRDVDTLMDIWGYRHVMLC